MTPKNHTYDHGKGDVCKFCGGIHTNPMAGHTFDQGKGDQCIKCGKIHRGGMRGHNLDYGKGIPCKKCGKIHINHTRGTKHTEEAKRRISENHKGKRIGDNNSARRPEVRAKISKALKGRKETWGNKISETVQQKFKNHPELREAMCKKMSIRRRTNTDPRYPKLQFIPELGHSVRSSWEKEFGLMLKTAGIPYAYEKIFFKFLWNGKTTTYHPDFKIKDDYFVETKGFLRSEGISRLNAFTEQYPNIKLVVLGLDTHIERNELNCRVIPWSERASLVEELKCL